MEMLDTITTRTREQKSFDLAIYDCYTVLINSNKYLTNCFASFIYEYCAHSYACRAQGVYVSALCDFMCVLITISLFAKQ